MDHQEAQALSVEELVLSKIRSNAAIVLCVEECNNWQLAPARAIVSRADPGLRRTVLVSSKLDTKFAQFGRCMPCPSTRRVYPSARPSVANLVLSTYPLQTGSHSGLHAVTDVTV